MKHCQTEIYLKAEIAGVLASDAAFFAAHPGVHYRIRKATPARMREVKVAELFNEVTRNGWTEIEGALS